MSNSNSLKIHVKDVFAIANTATAFVASSAIPLAVNTTTAFTALGSFVPRFATMAQLYRQFVIDRIVVSFVPNAGDTTGGSIAVAVDSDPFTTAPTTYGQVVRHRSGFFTDIKAPASFVWSSKQDNTSKKMVFVVAGRDEDQMSFGAIQIYSSNTVAALANIGNVMISVDATFTAPL